MKKIENMKPKEKSKLLSSISKILKANNKIGNYEAVEEQAVFVSTNILKSIN